MIEAIDSHYVWVRNRIKTINPGRIVLGVMDAQDWPPKDVRMEAFYLLVLGEVPLGRQAYSATIPVVVHTVQWVWLIVGTDVQQGIQLRSRGDRYRTDYQMRKELEYGAYPGFAQKQTVSVDATGALQQTPLVPTEFIVWSPVEFIPRRVDKASGLVYGAASVKITNMTDTIAA